MNPPASAAGGQEAGKPEGATFGVDAPMVPLALGGTALLLVIIGIVLMITSGLVAGLVAVIFGFKDVAFKPHFGLDARRDAVRDRAQIFKRLLR